MRLRVIGLDRVDSTNDHLREESLGSDLPEGTVVWAKEQTRGRGQGDNRWHSSAGLSLTFSILLRPYFLKPERQFSLNKTIALAVLRSVEAEFPANHPGAIKWPNDIYAGNRKAGGILIESAVLGNTVIRCIAGIGLNLNQKEFPGDLPNPVSIAMLSGKSYEPEEMLLRVCSGITEQYQRLLQGEEEELSLEYDNRLYLLGFQSGFSARDQIITGAVSRVDDWGRLVIRKTDGSEEAFSHGELTWPA
jgi:BirA family biotin operon repressor/biotin-[acetyl-CoA-carboxylase] ligase